eukprot:gene13106-13234_t
MKAVGSKSGLHRALEELTTLLPKALQFCGASEPESQSSPVIEKLRSVLLELLHGCLTCSTGKHVVAVLKILNLVLEKLPTAFIDGAQYKAICYLIQLLARLPVLQGLIDEQLLAVMSSICVLLADQNQNLLLEMHAGVIDMLLDVWEAYTKLALRLLLYQLHEFPTVLGPHTPGVMVAALGQMMCYSNSDLQELCLRVLSLMVLQQPHHGDVVVAVLQHVLWLLEVAAEGLLPAELVTGSWQQAAASALAACISALTDLKLLDIYGNRLVQCLSSAAVAPNLAGQAALWLQLVSSVLRGSPEQAAQAAVRLPLAVNTTPGAAGDASTQPACAGGAVDVALLDAWQLVAAWMATPDVSGELVGMWSWWRGSSWQCTRRCNYRHNLLLKLEAARHHLPKRSAKS